MRAILGTASNQLPMATPETASAQELDADALANDRDAFNAYAYLPWHEAMEELEKRANDEKLDAYLSELWPSGIPSIMEGKKSMALFRHIATPNYEIRRFAIGADALDTLQPLILEYTQDKFNNRNEWKFSLAKLRFSKGHDRHGNPISESKTIIDINAGNNQPISSIQTKWGQPLVDFHHELFADALPHLKDNVFDLSDWLHEKGPAAKDYYKAFLALFLKHGILFENFMIDSKEYGFTKDIILPAMLELEAETGYRPLIVALEPTHIEGDEFWLSHPPASIGVIDTKLAGQA